MYLNERLETKFTKSWDRDYNPDTGRFLSEDPIGLAGKDANLFRYVQNNPMNFTDPLGLLTFGIGFGGGFAIGGGGVSGDIQLVTDDQGNVGIAITGCAGGITEAAGLSLGGVGSAGSGETISDLEGGSFSTGGTVSVPGLPISPSAGGTVTVGDSPSGGSCSSNSKKKNGPVTATGFIGASTGLSFIDIGASRCKTKIIPL